MEREHLNNFQEIEKLKQKLAIYKLTLEALKVDLQMKNEYQEIKTENTILNEEIKVLKEKQQLELTRYDQQVKSLSSKIDSVNISIKQIKQDVSSLLSHVNNTHSFNEKNNFKEKEHALDCETEENNEINLRKEEDVQLKKQVTTTNQQSSSSYKRLQNMIKASNNIHPPLNQNKAELNRLVQKQPQIKQPYWQGGFPRILDGEQHFVQDRNQLHYSKAIPKNQMKLKKKVKGEGPNKI
ncbi:hypothetical protein ACJ2A9_03865 [Anaerobacillus sp. MEB173]|uniref:hypothetical protein n=1 Tax=Anaerobacillus sp. MEB173 TaxID=3383345 RepID=UPI003F8E2C39